MRTITCTILTLALAAAVALSATPALSGRKAAKAPKPVQSLLTYDETLCKWWGGVYFEVATDRDALIPITTAIHKARKTADSFAPNDPTVAREVQKLAEVMVRAVRYVYAHPELSPARHRYAMELRCMQPAEAPHTPEALLDWYDRSLEPAGPWR